MLGKIGKLLLLLSALFLAGLAYLYFLAPETAYRWGLAAERRLAGVEVQRVDAGGVEIEYLDSGGDGQPLVLLHGFGGNKDNWNRVVAELGDGYRVIAPDLPGFGNSDVAENGDYRFQAQAGRLHDFVEALELDRFHLAGNSMGGAIAGAYADAHPDRLYSLWLLAPAGVAGADASELQQHLEAGGANPLVATTPDEYYELLDWVFADPPYVPMPVKYVLAQQAVANQARYREIFDQINAQISGDFALEEIVSEAGVPTLVIWGEDDRLLDVSGARILAEASDQVQVERMPGVGHLPMMERPAASAAAFRAFADGSGEQR